MVKPRISYLEFSDKVENDDLEEFTRADLARFDYDPPKERCALVTWSSSGSCWKLIEGGDASRFEKLHDVGVMLFGMPPWRRSCVLRCVGKLGYVEQCIREMVPPGPDFIYSFVYDEPLVAAKSEVVPRAMALRGDSAMARQSVARERRWYRAKVLSQLDMFDAKGRR